MSTIGERIKFVLDTKNITRRELAERLNITTMAIGNLIRDEVKKPRVLEIAMALNVSPKWLQDGSGEMDLDHDDLLSDNKISSIEKDKDYSDTHIPLDRFDIKLSAGNGNSVEWIPRKSETPLLFTESWFKVRRLTPDSCKAMYVRGNSMSPVLDDWDTVVVDTNDTEIIDGEIYALIYKNSFYIKQVVRTGSGISLVSFNTEYAPIEINEDDLIHLRIIGRKVWRGG
ncbi:XRE family transcriptional regulator [Pasteurella multocida]|uniref:XRE family transcriptional regulator n=1 Tax=Pasteurella multocida TaxID=747 RepID=UPI0023402744|nr:S24 family peptidase [Pasteurella multocida]MDC4238435.1 helix-turn-helix domain-containing protein [Pasteurella multocida]